MIINFLKIFIDTYHFFEILNKIFIKIFQQEKILNELFINNLFWMFKKNIF